MGNQKKHYAKFKRNKWADVVYPCGVMAEAPKMGSCDTSKVTCERCLRFSKERKQRPK